MLSKMSCAWRAARFPAVLNGYPRRCEARPSCCSVPRPGMQNRISHVYRNAAATTTGVQMFSSSAPIHTADDDVDWQQRTRLLVGDHGLSALSATRVLLVGLGGVGGYAAEFLVRYVVHVVTAVPAGGARGHCNQPSPLPGQAWAP
jgi:hypothetical protein